MVLWLCACPPLSKPEFISMLEKANSGRRVNVGYGSNGPSFTNNDNPFPLIFQLVYEVIMMECMRNSVRLSNS